METGFRKWMRLKEIALSQDFIHQQQANFDVQGYNKENAERCKVCGQLPDDWDSPPNDGIYAFQTSMGTNGRACERCIENMRRSGTLAWTELDDPDNFDPDPATN